MRIKKDTKSLTIMPAERIDSAKTDAPSDSLAAEYENERVANSGFSSVRSRIRVLALCAVLAAVALALSFIESFIPLSIPGVKLGFANIVAVIALYLLGGRAAFSVNVLRILLAGLLFSGAFAMIYALAGGVLGVFAMILLKRAGAFGVIGVSVGGAAAHIAGQVGVAALIVQNAAIFSSLPFLMISAVVSGVIVGFIAYLVLNALPRDLR
ncbi:MAG: Gx transporter family protein [Clostridiales Family XIII bacterium]|jgi:heptaprenyl diphosphate synthase|nr:Gx transporter family protein [Clostridiales Family XIII bacterium]